MARLRLELPTLQNWSCHNCGGCCRQHEIEVTEDERQRIADQNWTEADGVPSDRPVLVPHAGPPWKKRYRLGHQPDGACVFLDEKGLCRIHAKFGERAKPLACRIYPYAFHPGGKQVRVSLRFSCPSVVANRGKPVSKQTGEIERLARAVVPERAREIPPPRVGPRQQVDWPDFLRLIDAIDRTLAERGAATSVKLLRALFWIDLAGQARFENVRGARLAEFLELISQAAQGEVAGDPDDFGEPSRLGRIQFGVLVAQYARKDTSATAGAGRTGRWKLLRSAVRFARGRGTVPPLQEPFREVPFAAVEQPFGKLPAEAEEMLTRLLRVKVQGIHFCGPAYYGVPLVEGFQSLALLYASTVWLARWLAAGDGRTQLEADDVARAISVADHHHGYSPIFGSRMFRSRTRLLARSGDVAKLVAWYSR